MKKIVIIIGILFFFQANVSMCSEKPQEQTWWQRLWSGWNSPLAVTNREKLKQAAVNVPIAAVTYRALPLLQAGPTARQLGSMAPYVMTGYLAFLLGVLAQELLHYARGGDWAIAIKTVKDVLSKIVRNPLLYPTKSLQLNALIKKDDFLKYINISGPGAQDILDQACTQLVQEIDSEHLSDEQITQEKEISAYIAQLKNQLNSLDSLEKQIIDLKGMESKQDSIIKMRGYLSLYYRLANQLEIEKNLTPEQKKEIYAWKFKVQEAVSKLTPEELQERQADWAQWQEKLKGARAKYQNTPEEKKQLIEKATKQQKEWKEKQQGK